MSSGLLGVAASILFTCSVVVSSCLLAFPVPLCPSPTRPTSSDFFDRERVSAGARWVYDHSLL